MPNTTKTEHVLALRSLLRDIHAILPQLDTALLRAIEPEGYLAAEDLTRVVERLGEARQAAAAIASDLARLEAPPKEPTRRVRVHTCDDLSPQAVEALFSRLFRCEPIVEQRRRGA